MISNRDSLSQLQTKVQADVRQLAGVTADEKQLPKSTSSLLSKRTTTGRNRSRSKANRALFCAVFSESLIPAVVTPPSCGWIRLPLK